MKFRDFLELVRVVRMLYGIGPAKRFFEKNIDLFSEVVDTDITALGISKKEK